MALASRSVHVFVAHRSHCIGRDFRAATAPAWIESRQFRSVSLWLNLEFVATVILGHFVFREHLAPRGWIAAGGTLIAALLLTGTRPAAESFPLS